MFRFLNKKLVKFIWLSFIGFFLFLVLTLTSIAYNLFGLFGDIPSFEILENPQRDLATSIYTSDGVLMGKYFDRENRTNVPYHKISKEVIKALVATEDERFEEHSGIDLRALLRVFKGLLTGNSSLGGGSTISQQVAKNLFDMRKEEKYRGPAYKNRVTRLLTIKFKEWITSVRLERAYTKRELITMYLNTVEFSRKSFGLHAASKTFFNKKPSDLKIEEAAVLIGSLKATSFYDPYRNKENAMKRRNVVFFQMERYGYLAPEKRDSLKYLPITLDYHPENYNEGIAPYFRAQIKTEIAKWCEENGYDILRSGLKIYTTIDSKIQRYARNAMLEHMPTLQKTFEKDWNNKQPFNNDYLIREIKKTPYYAEIKRRHKNRPDSVNYLLNKRRISQIFSWSTGVQDTSISYIGEIKHHKKFLHTGLVSIDPKTREVKAWVGGINHRMFPLDHVEQSRRQPGSTFKPIVYSTAMNNGYTPCSEFPDAPVTIKAGDGSYWEPKGTKYTGQMLPLKVALARSMNNITAKLMQNVGPKNAVNHAKALGIKSPLDAVLSLALGTSNVTVLEMTNAYGTFVNQGIHKDIICVKQIRDKNGKLLAEFSNEASSAKVMTPEKAYQVVSMLRGSVLIKGGTAVRLRTQYGLTQGNNQIGGKTGTTQRSTDGWFMGVTKDLVTGCWVGGDDNTIHFRSSYHGQGSRMAMPIYGSFMQKLYNDPSTGIRRGAFALPSGVDAAFIESITCDGEDDADSPDAVIDDIDIDIP